MNQRPALFDLASRYQLDGAATGRLFQLAGLNDEPAGLTRWLPRGVALLAAALVGLGLVLWVAANWAALGRVGQFAVLQGLLLLASAGAFRLSGARPALALLALLAIGALLAYFGQTYQTGADPWQLFALWGLLAMPLALAVRSDVLWTPWALVAMSAVALWAEAHANHDWFRSGVDRSDDLAVYVWAWGAAALLVVWLGPLARRLTGAGVWALRTAATLAVALVTLSALGGLFFGHGGVLPHYWLGLLVLVGAALLLALSVTFEVGSLSAVALGLDTLLVAGLGRWLFEGLHGGDSIGRLLILGLVAAGLLAASVSTILRVARYHASRRSGSDR